MPVFGCRCDLGTRSPCWFDLCSRCWCRFLRWHFDIPALSAGFKVPIRHLHQVPVRLNRHLMEPMPNRHQSCRHRFGMYKNIEVWQAVNWQLVTLDLSIWNLYPRTIGTLQVIASTDESLSVLYLEIFNSNLTPRGGNSARVTLRGPNFFSFFLFCRTRFYPTKAKCFIPRNWT